MNKSVVIIATSLLAIISFPQATKAQIPQLYPQNFELLCPAGFQPLNTPDAASYNPSTGFWRAYICADPFGNLTFNPGTVVTAPPGAPGGPGPTGSTAGGGCNAALVLPGMVCAGPVPQANGSNPVFEVAYANNSGSSTASPATVTGFPLTTSPSIGLLAVGLGSGGTVAAPDGTWTLLDNASSFNSITIYRKQFSSTSPVTLTDTFPPSGNTVWDSLLTFLGGTFSSIPNTATSTSVSCGPASNLCAGVTINGVTANNALVMFGFGTSNPPTTLTNATVSDSLGDVWQKVLYTSTPSSNGTGIIEYIDQFASAGTHVLTIDSHQISSGISSCCKVYEIAGTASYYSGAAGPAAFRYPTTMDLLNAGIIPGVLSIGTTTLSSNVTVTGADTTIMSVTVRAPSAGCPCRADIRYSGWTNFAGVTNEPDVDFWVSDGTNKMVPFTSGISNASGGGVTAVSASKYSDVLYANGANVTFTLHGITSSANAGTIQFVYTAAQPTGGSSANAYLQVSLVPSR